MGNELIPAKDVGRVLLDSWVEIVNEGRDQKIGRQDAAVLFWVAFGGDGVPDSEVSRILKSEERPRL